MTKGVIFDLDGTLLDTLESIAKSGNEMLRHYGFLPAPVARYGIYAGDGADVLVERALREAGDVTLSFYEEARKLYRECFHRFCSYEVKPYEGILPMLSALLEHQIPLAVYTNKPHENAVRLVEEYFGANTFTHILGQSPDRPRKPDPAGIFEITKDWGVSPKDCLYLGDTDVDMQTGTAAGCVTVGVLWGFREEKELLDHGARLLAHHPLEILPMAGIKE